MKRKILSLLMLLMTVSGAWADGSGTPDDPWISGDCTLILSEGTLTVSKKSGTGAMADYYDNTPWYSQKGDIKSIVIGSGVTSIGDYAFGDCTNLASVSIPASVTRLGDHAFQNYGTNATLTVTFAEGTSPMTIGESAFKNTNLTSITIPNRVTSIGNYAFGYCTNLASVSIPASVTSIGKEAFIRSGSNAAALTVTFAEGTSPMTIGSAAFAESNLTSITIPNRVTSIGNYAFYNNSNLASVYVMATIPPTIGDDAFANNKDGRKIYVPASSVGDASTDGTYKHNWSAYADDIEAFPVTATGDCGTNCTYTLYGNGQLVISGSGAMADYTTSDGTPWNSNRNDITSVVIESGVTSIGNYAFQECTNLASVSIPASVTSIGFSAFGNCGTNAAALTVTFAEGTSPMTIGNYAFAEANLTSITIPHRVTSIGNGAFQECNNLALVSIPASVTSIGEEAFYNCGTHAAALTVTFAEGTSPMTIGNYAFGGANLTSITIPNRVTRIDDNAFSECNNLASVSIPASVISIGETAFLQCGRNATALTVTFAEGSTPMTIGLGAFAESNLTSISIPNRVTSIGNYAFHQCTNLASVYVMASTPPALGELAFDGNASGRKIYVPASSVGDASTDGTYKHNWSAYADDIEALSAIGYCGDNCTYALHENGRLVISGTGAMADFPDPIDIPWLNNLSDITSVVIEEGVTSIGNWAFLECNKLASVSIPASVISIGEHAFKSCGTDATALTVTFAEGSTPMTIGHYAFGEAKLTSITIPNRVTSIGESAFFLCSSLASVYVMATNPPTIGDDAFANNKDGRKIYVPSTAVDTYKSEWSVYESYIEAITASGNCGAEGHVSDVRWVLAGESPNYTLAIMKVGETGAMADYNNLSSRPWYDYRSSITTVNIENGVTSIGKYAFEQFDKMTSITIGDGVTSIGDYAFHRCKGLTSLTVPNGLATIGKDVFVGCIGLATITVASGNTAFKAENGVLLTDDGTELVLYPAAKAATTYTIPDYVTTIRDCAFYKCNLTEVTIPASVTNIGQQAFCECSNLATVTLLPVTPPTLGVSVFDDIGTNVNSNDKKFYFHGTAYGSNTDWNVSGYTPTVIYGATLSSGATTSTEAICSEGTTKYYTEGASITLGHGDAPTGYTFGGYTAKDAADNDITATAISGSTLTMPASDVTVSVSFKKLLTNTDITIAEIADQTYTGSEIKPAVTVKDGETDITDQCDITYTNNTNAGTATVTIKAKASSTSYAGETTKSFKIILTGDINGDNVVNVADIVKAINDGKSQDEIKKIEKIIMNK